MGLWSCPLDLVMIVLDTPEHVNNMIEERETAGTVESKVKLVHL